MRIAFLGAGTWGYCLATLLASKGHELVVWARDPEFVKLLSEKRVHPKLPFLTAPDNIRFTNSLSDAIEGADLIAEAVTTAGIRSVFDAVKELACPHCPIVLASKGVEQGTGLLIPEMVLEVLGEDYRDQIGLISGPGHAEEVCRGLPTTVVSAGYNEATTQLIAETFTTPSFRVYPNQDVAGVAFGGAMKNIMAIACGISQGLGLGDGAKAAIMTRGLHEIRKLSAVKGCQPETLNGLAGLGDLAVTCMSEHSRNNRFGQYLAAGLDKESAIAKVGMVVEGVYTCRSAHELSQQSGIPAPITEGVYHVVYEGREPKQVVQALMTRTIKEEKL